MTLPARDTESGRQDAVRHLDARFVSGGGLGGWWGLFSEPFAGPGFSGGSEKKRVGDQERVERLAVALRDGQVLLADDNPVALDGLHLRRLDDVRPVNPHEAVRRQLLLERLEVHERENGTGLVVDVDFDVVLQPLDVGDALQFDLLQPVLGPQEDALRLLPGRRKRLGAPLHLEPAERLVGRLQKVGVADGLEQVVEGPHAEPLDGILGEGRGENHAGLLGQHARELHAVEPRHLDVAEEQVDGCLAQRLAGRNAAPERGLQFEKRRLAHVGFHQLDGQRLVVDYGTGQSHGSSNLMQSSAR